MGKRIVFVLLLVILLVTPAFASAQAERDGNVNNVIGFIGAMDEEVATLINDMESSYKTTYAGLDFYSGKLKGQNVVVVKSGIGKVNSGMCAQILIDKYAVSSIINTGVAGGITKKMDLKIGDLVVATDAIQHDVDVTVFGYKKGEIPRMENSIFVADSKLQNLAMNSINVLPFEINVYKGRVVSGDQFISNSEKVKELVELFDPACVEMEGASIAQVCALNKVPFLIIRAISDSATDDAHVDYSVFEKAAAKNSALLCEKMLENIK